MTQSSIYCVDTSSFMDWQARHYPIDVFPNLIVRIDSLISAGRLVTPALVQEELKAVGTTGINAWVKARKHIIVPTKDILNEALAIQNQFTGLLDPRAEYEEADAYVIALARLRKGVVVAQETSAAEKRNPKRTHFIPDVCRELGVQCVSLLGLIRLEGWTF